MELENIDIGKWVEGTVHLDPTTGRYVVSSQEHDAAGKRIVLDAQEVLSLYEGQQVRMIITPLSAIQKLSAMVESGSVSLEQASYKSSS